MLFDHIAIGCRRCHNFIRPVLLFGVLFLLAASGVSAQCFMCHGDSSFTKSSGGHEISLYVDSAVFANSVHGMLDCKDCHTGIDSLAWFPPADTGKSDA
jgi:hypothetical protein